MGWKLVRKDRRTGKRAIYKRLRPSVNYYEKYILAAA